MDWKRVDKVFVLYPLLDSGMHTLRCTIDLKVCTRYSLSGMESYNASKEGGTTWFEFIV